MAKTCGVCEKSTQAGGTANANGFTIHCTCSVTGKVHPSDHQCDVPEKPRLCEVLGVDVGERFRVYNEFGDNPFEFYIDDKGYLCEAGTGAKNIGIYWLTTVINHPEKIERVPRLTPEEVQRCKVFGAKWVSHDRDSNLVWLWEERPELKPNGVWDGGTSCAQARDRFFPSVLPGQLVRVEDEP